MQSIEYAGFSAILEALVDQKDGALYLCFAGNTTSARAIAAALLSVDLRKRSSGIRIDGSSVNLERHAKYRVKTQQVQHRGRHGVTMRVHIIHNAMTAQNTEASTLYFLVPEDHDPNTPPEGFIQRLRLAVRIPMPPEWEPWLWTEGQQEVRSVYKPEGYLYGGRYDRKASIDVREQWTTLIKPMTATGVGCWKVENNQAAWVNVERRHFGLQQELKRNGYDKHTNDEWAVILKKGLWTLWHNGEQMMTDKGTPHGSDKLDEALWIAEYVYGEKLVLEGTS